MRTISTANNRTVQVSDLEHAAVTQHVWRAMPNGYVYRMVGRKKIFLHREILNAQRGQIVDHADRNPLNNTRENLRIATSAENRANSKKMLRAGKALSPFKGVTKLPGAKRGKPWQVYVKRTYLGVYATQEEAAEVYDREARRMYGEFACTNEMLGAA